MIWVISRFLHRLDGGAGFFCILVKVDTPVVCCNFKRLCRFFQRLQQRIAYCACNRRSSAAAACGSSN
jgi:hypothetical protein